LSHFSHHEHEDSTFHAFHCVRCRTLVTNPEAGTEQRNHCPGCLWSLHVDFMNGDRRSACRAAMEPIAVHARQKGEWSLIHRCTRCGALRMNRIAGDDNEALLLSLALRPIALPAFPLERAGR
jgi:ribosome biogenesis GTPase